MVITKIGRCVKSEESLNLFLNGGNVGGNVGNTEVIGFETNFLQLQQFFTNFNNYISKCIF